MSLIRYRPIIKNKEAEMAIDVSGAWTSLTCYYTLHDKIVTLQAENERMRKALDAIGPVLIEPTTIAVNAAKGVQS
jgi:hypothetical protein